MFSDDVSTDAESRHDQRHADKEQRRQRDESGKTKEVHLTSDLPSVYASDDANAAHARMR